MHKELKGVKPNGKTKKGNRPVGCLSGGSMGKVIKRWRHPKGAVILVWAGRGRPLIFG